MQSSYGQPPFMQMPPRGATLSPMPGSLVYGSNQQQGGPRMSGIPGPRFSTMIMSSASAVSPQTPTGPGMDSMGMLPHPMAIRMQQHQQGINPGDLPPGHPGQLLAGAPHSFPPGMPPISQGGGDIGPPTGPGGQQMLPGMRMMGPGGPGMPPFSQGQPMPPQVAMRMRLPLPGGISGPGVGSVAPGAPTMIRTPEGMIRTPEGMIRTPDGMIRAPPLLQEQPLLIQDLLEEVGAQLSHLHYHTS
jgi:hypothetical protein